MELFIAKSFTLLAAGWLFADAVYSAKGRRWFATAAAGTLSLGLLWTAYMFLGAFLW